MSKIIFKPAREKQTSRYIVGGRLAWFYRYGTIIETRKGQRYEKVSIGDSDSFGYWEAR